MTTWEAGMSVTADRLNDVPGYVSNGQRTAASAAVTTVETVVQSLTFAAVQGAQYKVTAVQGVQADAAGGSAVTRIRYAAGATVTSAGTAIATVIVPFYLANLGFIHTLVGVLTAGATGNLTVGFTVVRNTGTANVSSYGAANMINTLLVERVG